MPRKLKGTPEIREWESIQTTLALGIDRSVGRLIFKGRTCIQQKTIFVQIKRSPLLTAAFPTIQRGTHGKIVRLVFNMFD